MIYSFIGWSIESIYFYLSFGHFIKRGFLLSPLCAVYGIGSLFVIIISEKLTRQPFLLFLYSSASITVLEFITGILLINVLHRRMWDYSMQPMNLSGVICLRNTIVWGILSLLIVYVLHPFFTKTVTSLNINKKTSACYVLSLLLSVDILISVYSSLHGVSSAELVSEFYMHKVKQLGFITDQALRVLR
jgi:uncharacterized membrane protein